MNQQVKSMLSGLGCFAAAATIWMWGYSVGEGKSEAITEVIKEERDSLRIEVSKISNEADSLKVQLLTSVQQKSNPLIPNTKFLEIQPVGNGTKKEVINKPKEPESLSETLVISTQESGIFFEGAILITLIATNYTGNPLRHQVLANVLIPGQKTFEIRDADPGSAFIVGDYQVLIVTSGTYSAGFKLFKLKT